MMMLAKDESLMPNGRSTDKTAESRVAVTKRGILMAIAVAFVLFNSLDSNISLGQGRGLFRARVESEHKKQQEFLQEEAALSLEEKEKLLLDRDAIGVVPANDKREKEIPEQEILEPSSTKVVVPAANVTVLLDARDRVEYAYSIFLTGAVKRFGTGRLNYEIKRVDMGVDEEGRLDAIVQEVRSPCLLLSRQPAVVNIWQQVPEAPDCLFMHTNDEFCRGSGAVETHVRAYSGGANVMKNAAYLPLGPRHDFWEAFEAAKREDSFVIKPPSERGLLFNAMFSKSTSQSRQELAEILDNSEEMRQKYPALIQISDNFKWTASLSKQHVGPQEYAQNLLNSAFTLSPTGHNPECFRLFEAMEAGSIPVISIDNTYKNHKCKDSLSLMIDSGAPVVSLSSWRQLPAVLEELMQDQGTLDQRQAELRQWYSEFMRKVVAKFEDKMLGELDVRNA